jgi:hypothetical protein
LLSITVAAVIFFLLLQLLASRVPGFVLTWKKFLTALYAVVYEMQKFLIVLEVFFAKRAIVVAAKRQLSRQVFVCRVVIKKPAALAGGDQISRYL